MPAGRRSVRAQLLMAAVSNAMASSAHDDYLNAVTNLSCAASISGYKLPPSPPGMPDIVRGTVWMKWRSYYHTNAPGVFAHVDKVLASLNANELGVEED